MDRHGILYTLNQCFSAGFLAETSRAQSLMQQ